MFLPHPGCHGVRLHLGLKSMRVELFRSDNKLHQSEKYAGNHGLGWMRSIPSAWSNVPSMVFISISC